MATQAADPFSSSEGTAEKALSFLSKGWQGVRDSADADIRLMRARANNFKSIADREIENFLNSGTPAFPPTSPPQSASTSISELEFLKRIRPKLSEIRSAYSSPEFGKKVLERWGGPENSGARLGIDLSSIRSALVTEVGVGRTVWYPEWEKRKRTGLTARSVWWKGEEEDEEEETETNAWDPIRKLKTRLRELERKSHSYEILENIKNSEFVEKVKSSMKSMCADNQDTKDVPPLDVPELLAYLIKQSGPLVEQLGFNRDICDKMVDALYGKRKGQLIRPSVSMGDLESADSNDDELESRINAVLQSTGHHTDGSFWDNRIHDDSDNKRHVAIVTTASLPWMTGTAVNPLFRAAYLAKSAEQNVTLLVPWLCRSDQELVYPNNLTFSSPGDQESYIRNWLEERVGFKTDFKISFYPGKFSKERRSIIPAGDTTQFISSKEADIAILEEPEHLNWYHHGKRWTDKFNHVIGVVHTNYLEYIKREKNGALKAFFVTHINNWVIRAYCDKVLRLSAATQDVPKSTVCNVHGVNPKFLKIGEKVASEKEEGQTTFSKGAYFLGKMVWAKGYKELIDLMAEHKSDLDGFKLDVYGSGEDANEVQSAAKNLNLNLNFMKGRDHADDSLHGYKVFINPSISDVLCTATAEALAMGKFVVCADHPSNNFFKAFPNCLTYKSSEDFVARIREAMAGEPRSLTPEQRYRLSWEAATKRFLEYSELNKVLNGKSYPEHFTRDDNSKKIRKSVSMPSLSEVADGGLAFAHYCLTASEILRLSTGAIPNTRDYGMQHSKDLKLYPPQVQNPVYGW